MLTKLIFTVWAQNMLIEVILNLARLAAWINKTNKLLILFTFLSTLLDLGENVLRNPHAEEGCLSSAFKCWECLTFLTIALIGVS